MTTVIRPEQALRAGRSDARNLLIVWYARKSVYPLLILGMLGAYISGRNDTDIEWSDPSEMVRALLSPLAALVLAFAVRVGANVAGMAIAFPLARDRDATLETRTGLGRRVSRWLDLRQVTRAYRSLRWTHHVRQEALRRVAPTSRLKWRLDQIFDVTTIALLVVMVAVIWISASS